MDDLFSMPKSAGYLPASMFEFRLVQYEMYGGWREMNPPDGDWTLVSSGVTAAGHVIAVWARRVGR